METTQEEFQVRVYLKTELAQLYAPHLNRSRIEEDAKMDPPEPRALPRTVCRHGRKE